MRTGYNPHRLEADEAVMGWTVVSNLFFVLQIIAQPDAVVTQTMRIEIDKRIHSDL